MKLQNFSNYSKLYETKLLECNFLTEQNITAQDIILPLEDLINEEFIGQWLKDKWQKGKQAAKDVYKSVKTAVANWFSKVVDFFKNFSLSKLTSSIWSKIKEIGAAAWSKVKDALSGFRDFILQNNLCNDNNTPNFKNIWSVICQKAKSIIDWNKEGVSPEQVQQAGDKVAIKESKFDIGEDEVKYYGMFEKVAYALGIKNARFNGVVSQILKKGTIGLIIIGLIKISGLSLAGLGLGAAMSPVALAAIGGMLLMAGLIILAIWICKPYPTVDDCLAYLHIAFSDKLEDSGMVNIFKPTIDGPDVDKIGDNQDKSGEQSTDITDKDVEEAKPLKSMYPVMIKNLKALQSMLISFDGVSIEGEETKGSETADRSLQRKRQRETVRESLASFAIFEKEMGKSQRNVTITKGEDYLVQAFKNVSKLIKSTKDEKDKGIGITQEYLEEIISKKMDAKDVVKELYYDVYDHLYGKYAKTIPDFGPLYNESVEDLSDARKRKVVAEKIARLSKRTMQFENENMYGGLGEFGDDMKEFNSTLKEIMSSIKAEGIKESKRNRIRY